MNQQPEHNGFSYTYSAKEQAELKRIREKYADNEDGENKMERVRRLDASVTKKARLVSLIVGIVGALILGIGMSLFMSEFSAVLGAYRHLALPLGIVIGLVGCLTLCLAYPLYQIIVKHERKKIAPEILRLTDELMK